MSSFDFEKWSQAKSLCDELPDICSRRMKKIELFRTLFDYGDNSWAVEVGDPEFPIVRKTGLKTLKDAEELKFEIMRKLANVKDGEVEAVLKELVTTK